MNLFEFKYDYPKEPKTFGEMIRKARLDRGMQSKQLARLVGVTPETIQNWEIHNRIPESRQNLEKLREILGLQIPVF